MGLEVGQTIYLEPTGNAARRSKEIKESVITKVGRKFFEVEPQYGRFFIDTMRQDGGQYSSNYQAYLSKQDIDDKNEVIGLRYKLKRLIEFGDLSLTELRTINNIISPEKK